MSNNRVLGYSPGMAGPPTKRAIAADIETDGLGGQFIIGAWLPDGGIVRFFTDPAEMIRAFVVHRFYGWELLFHNADYDLRYLLPALEDLTTEGYTTSIICDGSGRVIHVSIRKDRHAWHIRDTYTLMPLPLAQLAVFAGMEKLDIGLQAGAVFDPSNPDHMAYLERDVTMLLRAYKRFGLDLKQIFGVRPSYSIGTTGVRVFRATLPEGDVYYRQRPEVEAMGRAGYFGGITWLRSIREHYNVTKIDTNGMYAAAMLAGVPTGSGCYTRREIEGLPGIYRCRVYCNSHVRFPFVPVREGTRIVYPHGWFDAVLTTNTIQYARRAGYDIYPIDGYFFDKIEGVFDNFIAQCQHLEDTYKESGAGVIAKMLRNSLYGKLGQRGDSREYFLTTDPSPEMTPVLTLEGVILDNLHYIDTVQERANMMPIWAAWITATARIMLAETITAIGPGWCIYGDTDSIVVDNDALQQAIRLGAVTLGSMYGMWKVERVYEVFRAAAPKYYIGAYRNEAGDLVLDGAHKGIPDRAIHVAELHAIYNEYPAFVEYDQLARAINTTGGRPRRERIRKSVLPVNLRFETNSDGDVLPVLYDGGGMI